MRLDIVDNVIYKVVIFEVLYDYDYGSSAHSWLI